MNIKEKWVSLFIPRNTPYCHHNFKYNKKINKYCAKPCKYWCWKYNEEYGDGMEYCKYLKEFLSIQDQVKDCGINEDYEVE